MKLLFYFSFFPIFFFFLVPTKEEKQEKKGRRTPTRKTATTKGELLLPNVTANCHFITNEKKGRRRTNDKIRRIKPKKTNKRRERVREQKRQPSKTSGCKG
eukprot:TRINITY_DN8098_c3_g1_i1.p1 TRINITY_DN8098_c3_g1~~TRINITY_DN8098_c3_g1_i1.p1  ORF type:complete len:101 (-),score=14.32 TRINITY_DN8098_c3_g1_i1:129-431(-)